jgi:hypothetical protein
MTPPSSGPDPRPSFGQALRRLAAPRPLAILGAGLVVTVAIVAAAMLAGPPSPDGSDVARNGAATPTASIDPVGSGASFPATSSSVPASPGASPAVGSSGPSPRPTPRPASARPRLPLPGDGDVLGQSVELAAADDGSLYVAAVWRGGTVLVRLDAAGKPATGWPISLGEDSFCSAPMPARDGSVRLLCDVGEDANQRVYAFDRSARALRGWPVMFDPELLIRAPRVIGDQLLVVLEEPGPGITTSASVAAVFADGSIHRGPPVESQSVAWRFGPDGAAYGSAYDEDARTTSIIAIDRDGVRAGWPVDIAAYASEPAFGPDGRIVVVVGDAQGTPTRTLSFDRDGGANEAGSEVLPEVAMFTSGAVDTPAPPIVSADGSAIVVAYDQVGGSHSLWALSPQGDLLAGWPYHPAAGFTVPGVCAPEERGGCGLGVAMPVLGTDLTVYVLEPALNDAAGGRVVALRRDGRVAAGWPVGLRRPRSEFWSVVARPDGGVFALAIEPESPGVSASILSIARDSAVRYVTTIIQP